MIVDFRLRAPDPTRRQSSTRHLALHPKSKIFFPAAGTPLTRHPSGRAGSSLPSPDVLSDMGVYLGRLRIRMAQQFLQRPNVRPAFEQVGREGMAQGMRARLLVDQRLLHRPSHRAGLALLVHVMTPDVKKRGHKKRGQDAHFNRALAG